jgi:hypothetical protein
MYVNILFAVVAINNEPCCLIKKEIYYSAQMNFIKNTSLNNEYLNLFTLARFAIANLFRDTISIVFCEITSESERLSLF